jgi:TrmH family RNA methyltransferase
MISKAQIKHLNSLKLLKFRKANGEFVVEGEKMVDELIMSNYQINALYAVPAWLEANQDKLASKKINSEKVSSKELERISSFKSPNQVLATAVIPDQSIPKIDFEDLILVLDNIQDPGNMGTIIRTAEWFGIKNIICSKESADLYNPKVIQATMGSFLRLKTHYTDLKNFFKKDIPNDIKIYGALLNGKNIYEQTLTKKGILIIGNESNGISEEISKFVTHPILIPAHATSKAESLNASIAAAVLMSEFRK